MSTETQWYVMQGEEQLGPYSGDQLVEFATEGNITRESMVWSEGMPEWLPADQIEGLFPTEAAAQDMQVPDVSSTHDQQPAPGSEGPYPNPGVKPASFGLWLGLLLGGVALIVIGVLLVINVAASAGNGGGEVNELTDAQAGGMGIGAIVVLTGYLVTFLSFIPFYICLYRAWACLQPGGLARTTPGKAIGFLFIPFFNIYWIFQAINGLATDWNRTVSAYGDLKAAPKLSESVFLIFCIGCFLFPLSLIMIFPLMSQMCAGVNYFAYRPKPGQFSALGGFKKI